VKASPDADTKTTKELKLAFLCRRIQFALRQSDLTPFMLGVSLQIARQACFWSLPRPICAFLRVLIKQKEVDGIAEALERVCATPHLVI
jgi:hypothetical protein